MTNRVISGYVLSGTLALGLLIAPASALASFGYGGGTTVTVAVAPNPDGSQTGTVAGATTATETTSAGSVTLQTPAGLQVTGPAGWTGDITLPTVTVTTVAPVADSGNNASAVSSIAVGFGDSLLTFNKAVQLVFAGQAGNSIGYSHGSGTFHQITATCADNTQATNDGLADGADCKINVSGDLVVWTKHFSTFTTYTQSAIPAPASSGGGGGSGPVGLFGTTNAIIPTLASAGTGTGTGGEVLGAAAYNFTLSLGIGSTGADVTALQQTLIDEGFLKIVAPTGYFGGLTQAALKQYQAKYGIAQVGLVGPQTRAQLNKGSAPASGTHSVTQAQADAILGLLSSFGADASIIANVKTSLGY